eukprot:7858108-Lingulodinium_polyedra.AAC.1
MDARWPATRVNAARETRLQRAPLGLLAHGASFSDLSHSHVMTSMSCHDLSHNHVMTVMSCHDSQS